MSFNPATAWFLSQCAEARGMQDMWKSVKPEVMKKLRESAIIQSAESSNRMEGVEVNKKRLLELVMHHKQPLDRPEEEIAGYRKALDFIHNNYKQISMTPESIKKLHELAQGGLVGDADKWKERNNDIIEIHPNGERIIRFSPVPPEDVQKYIEQLCLGYRDTVANNRIPELVAVAGFVFDFLCIHPFRDGNGRVSRLITLLLLYQNGYEVGRYISLERIVEETKEGYYETLKRSSQNWFDASHDLVPWWNYFIGTIKSAYQELKTRVEMSSPDDTMSSLIRQTALAFITAFSVADICKQHPAIDRELVKKVLASLKSEGLLMLSGKGRGARWKKLP